MTPIAGRYGTSFTLPAGSYTIVASVQGTADYVGDSYTQTFSVV